MFTIEYRIMINDKDYYFSVSNESLTILKRNSERDVLDYAKNNNLTGECEVEMTVTYDDEFYDIDLFSINISENYGSAKIIV